MNNFTKTEALPKSGHVNEVCKEWLVREDGALAYKLQSQEINHFYKGNRFRNAVVREDFPVALHEQIKEKENAEKQSEYYRRKLIEQEEHDKRIAKEIASKLERDLEEQQQRELQESEMIAQQMQEIYVNLPPPTQVTSRDQLKPPPRPAKSSYLQQTSNEATTSAAAAVATTSSSSSSSSSRHHQQQQQQQQHQRPPLTTQHFNNNITNSCLHSSHHNAAHVLVSDEFAAVIPPQQPPFTNQFVDRSNQSGRPHPALTTDNFPQLQQQYQNQQQLMAQLNQQRHHHHQHQHHHNSSAASNSLSSTSSSGSSRRNVLESLASCAPIALNSLNSPQSPLSPTYAPASLTPSTPTNNSSSTTTINSNIPPPLPLSKPQPKPLTPEVEELVEYSDVADRLRRYDILPDSLNSPQILSKHSPTQTTNAQQQHAQAQPKHSPPPAPLTQQSPTHLKSNFNKLLSPSSENLLRADHKFQKLSPEKYDQLVGNDLLGNNGSGSMAADAAERHMQQHANDIELYVDPCDYASLKEIGLPMEEIKEMSKKIKQEQKDELFARRLQDLEANSDGLSQEERDRMLAIEAQDKELARMLQEREKAKAKRAKEKARARKSQQRENGTGNGLHCGPLLPLPQDCMSSTSSKLSKHSMHSTNNHDEMLDMEAYSNPIDVINQQKLQNGGSISQNGGSINGGSLTRHDQQQTANGRYDTEHLHEDDIYTLPVDNCRAGQRPSSLNIMPETGHVSPHNSMTRSENYSLDSHESQNSHHDISPRMNYNKTGGSFDQNSSPTPPYMPIQGTRRSNSSEERKKKSKDKCTHQ